MLGVRDISLRFGDLFALKSVTFGVGSGEIVDRAEWGRQDDAA